MPDPCLDVESETCDCPEAEMSGGTNNTECGAISLGHPEVTLAHDVVRHIDPFLAIKYRYRTA